MLTPFNGVASLFRRPSHHDLRRQHLADARLQLLEAQAASEYWSGMAAVLQARVTRLQAEMEASAVTAAEPRLIVVAGDTTPLRIQRNSIES